MTQISPDDLFEYDSIRGLLIWKNPPEPNRKRLMGKVAGTLDKNGYSVVMFRKKCFKVHHLIWFIESGKWPRRIDHKDGVKSNNRFLNLREVTHRQNMQNMKRHRSGKLVGAHYHRRQKVWRSHIVKDGKQIHLGNFSTEFAAHWRYLQELQNVANVI